MTERQRGHDQHVMPISSIDVRFGCGGGMTERQRGHDHHVMPVSSIFSVGTEETA